MSKITSLIRRTPKRLAAVVAVIAAAIIIPAAAFAWGPDRPLYTWANPADHVTFNSMTDNPVQGDERNFMQIREANAGADTYTDSITLQPNKEYVVNIYYHNNASTTLNDAAHNYAGIARNAYVKAQIPNVVTKGATATKSVGFVGASNATPAEVWDDVAFSNKTNGDIYLRYVPGSATIHNFGSTNGKSLSDSIITTGAPIGYNALDGNVPGCNEFSGYVTFRIKATQGDFTVEKQVRVAGETEYKTNITAKPGDKLEYRIQYKNTGSIQTNNVVVKDTLPAHVSYLAGTTTLKNGNFPNGKTISDNLTTKGVNIGDYPAGINAFVKFEAKVDDVAKLKCGLNKLTNTVSVQVGDETKTATATVNVNKDCPKTPPTTPPELPHTGAGESILAIIGLGAIVASVVYYVSSRKALNK